MSSFGNEKYDKPVWMPDANWIVLNKLSDIYGPVFTDLLKKVCTTEVNEWKDFIYRIPHSNDNPFSSIPG